MADRGGGRRCHRISTTGQYRLAGGGVGRSTCSPAGPPSFFVSLVVWFSLSLLFLSTAATTQNKRQDETHIGFKGYGLRSGGADWFFTIHASTSDMRRIHERFHTVTMTAAQAGAVVADINCKGDFGFTFTLPNDFMRKCTLAAAGGGAAAGAGARVPRAGWCARVRQTTGGDAGACVSERIGRLTWLVCVCLTRSAVLVWRHPPASRGPPLWFVPGCQTAVRHIVVGGGGQKAIFDAAEAIRYDQRPKNSKRVYVGCRDALGSGAHRTPMRRAARAPPPARGARTSAVFLETDFLPLSIGFELLDLVLALDSPSLGRCAARFSSPRVPAVLSTPCPPTETCGTVRTLRATSRSTRKICRAGAMKRGRAVLGFAPSPRNCAA